MKISRNALTLGLTALWVLFVLLSAVQFNPLHILDIIGFGALLMCFGLPMYLLLRLKKQPPLMMVTAVVILGVLQLMVYPLIFNTFAPHIGIARPLDAAPLIIWLSLCVTVVLTVMWIRLKGITYKLSIPKLSWLDAVFLGLPALFVLLSIMGATLLNNGGTGWITLTMLFGMTVYLGFLLAYHRRLSDTTIAAALFMIAVALLFMTSLRGWLTTGHDIQREYRMFQLAQNAGVWDIAAYRDPYNACLSITILPTIFSNLLGLSDPYIFKVLFQVIFALVPVVVYFFARRYTGKGMAVLAVLYFMAFPTFFGDMPMLNRQEIAFAFLALMLYFVLDQRLSPWKRRGLFLLFGAGLVLAHYSTTYSFVVIVGVLVVLRPLLGFVLDKLPKRRLFRNSGIAALADGQANKKVSISFVTVVLLVGMAFLWNTVITNTSGGLVNIVKQLTTTISSGFKSDARSNDTSYSLVSAKKVDPQGQLDSYVQNVVQKARQQEPAGTYYDDNIVNAYPLKALPPPTMPLTPTGQWLAGLGLDVPLFNFATKQISARLLQLFIAIGIGYVLFRRLFNKPIETDFFLVVLGSLAFIVLQIVLPFLSVEYGLLRAFQQALMVLGLFVAIGTAVIAMPFKQEWLNRLAPAAFALLFFVTSTSAVGQLLGGYSPQLHLNNDGTYYDIYYLHRGEITSINWLSQRLYADDAASRLQSEIQSDRYALTKLRNSSDLRLNDDIAPGLIRKNSYVFLSYANVHKNQATITYNSDLVTYQMPIEFLDNNKNLVYSNGDAEFYR